MRDEIFWTAVKQNDKRFDGIVYTCVQSTGIFCKPSCTARLPKRRNVSFVDSIKKAEEKGFRACLRCKPKETGETDARVKKMVKVCELIETEENVSLESLGAAVDLSPAYLQRTFKKIIGVSPKKYADGKRIEKFKAEIREGREVVDAMYEAGYGSSSRLYENVSSKMGMTPTVYKSGGKGTKIEFAITDCELGRLLVARTDRGICSVKFGDDDEALADELTAEYPKADIAQESARLRDFLRLILENISGKAHEIDIPLDVKGTAFQMKVWDALKRIPYGKTITYKQLAERIGNPKAVRAVASACAKNRVALVIPCHRVIGSNGKLSGYRWGIERKKMLIERESRAAE